MTEGIMDKKATVRSIRYGVVLALYSGMWAGAQAGGLSRPVDFNIPAEPLPPALMQFSDQADVQLVSQASGISHSRTQGVSGLMPINNGLDRLLKGTQFSYAFVGGKTIAIKGPVARRQPQHSLRVAQVEAPRQGGADAPAPPQTQQEKDPQQNPAQLGKGTVTGTRIKRTDVETAQPILRISSQQIERSGYTNIGNLLGQLSSAGAFLNTSVNNGGNGEVHVNLRNLGANRNLVLVDGKRWIPSLGGTVNLNTIPTSIVDHIEILQDGASAVYGSDAIAGVINVITKKNFRGTEVHAYYGIHNDHQTGYWDGQVKQYDFTVGGGNDRGNVVFSATYRQHNAVYAGNRQISRTPIYGAPPTIGGSSTTPKGRFELFGRAVGGRMLGQGTCGAYDPRNPTHTLCELTLQNAPAQPSTGNFRNYTPDDSYNFAPDNYRMTPGKEVSTYAEGHYDLLDNVTFTANAVYVRDDADILRAPGTWEVGAFTRTTANGKLIGIDASNPYNPFGVDLVADSSDPCIRKGTCIGLGEIQRRPIESGPRLYSYTRDYFHISAGFNGYFNLLNREIDWDVGFAQNRVQEVRIRHGGVFNTQRLATALGPVKTCDATPGCVPFNFFGGSVEGRGGSITQDQIDYIEFEPHRVSQSNLRDWTVNLSSDVYDLPAGPLGVAVGYERLDNYGYSHPDALVVEGVASSNVASPLNGRVVRNAEYAELNIPLLRDLPGVNDLSIDVANRWTQFDRSGGIEGQNHESFLHNSSGRLNIRYQVINDLLLRASWSQGFRSPNVSELFGGTSRSSPSLIDPCAGGTYGGHKPGTPLPPNCPGGRPDIQSYLQLPGTSVSNPDLQPEHSISRSAGFVYNPSQVPGLDLNADYFKIELNNTIATVGYQNIVNGCFYNSTFCDLVSVRGNHIVDIRNILTNVGGELTEGIDAGIRYKFPSTPFGDFDARIDGTFVTKFDETEVNLATRTGFATSHLAGVGVHPKRRLNGYLNWDYGNWSAQYHIEYIGHVVTECQNGIYDDVSLCTPSLRDATTDFQGTPDEIPHGKNYLGATVYHDVHVAYTVPAIHTTFGLGVQNLFDKKPPSSHANGSHGYEIELYRPPSRLVYGSIRVKF
jgi:outer membrane receptor protein involved in Fe transport